MFTPDNNNYQRYHEIFSLFMIASVKGENVLCANKQYITFDYYFEGKEENDQFNCKLSKVRV